MDVSMTESNPRLVVRLLGTTRVEVEGAELRLPERVQTLRLMSYLLLHAGVPRDRSRVAEELWPEEPRARFNLRHTLHHLVKYLPAPDAEHAWIARDRSTVGWNPSADYLLDVTQIAEAAALTEDLPPPSSTEADELVALLTAAADLYEGPLLAGHDEPWLEPLRESVEHDLRSVLDGLSRLYEERGERERAIELARQQAAHDPLDEAAHVRLMKFYWAAGDRAAALRQFDACKSALDEGLGVPPDQETIALRDAIRDGDESELALGTVDGADDTHRASLEPLPLPTSSADYVDQRERVITVSGVLETSRLVTLHGPGGVGKSRLALEVVRVEGHPWDSRWWSPLDDATQYEELLDAIAGAVGGLDRPADLATIVRRIGREQGVLVLDGVDTVLDDVASMVSKLLSECPNLTILVTSREGLRVAGEQVWRVPSLDAAGLDSGSHRARFPEAIQYAVQQARVHVPSILESDALRSELARICLLLDGLPLAIDLAVARLNDLSASDLREQIEKSLDIVSDAGEGRASRHGSLRACFESSTSRLDLSAVRLLSRMAVFDGAFSLDAAEAVCADRADESEEPGAERGSPGVDRSESGAEASIPRERVLDLVGRLAAASMLNVESDASRRLRYRLTNIVRFFAHELLITTGEAERITERHEAWLSTERDDI